MFLDLHNACMSHEDSIPDRVRAFTETVQGVAVIAVGGFPITTENDTLRWCGGPATADRIRGEFAKGLGTSAVLTYMNKAGHSLEKLSSICVERKHDWAFRWMTLSLVFSNVDIAVELAFARDTRFLLSWPVATANTQRPRVFVASGTLKDWVKFVANADSPDFDKYTRAAMQKAAELLQELLPRPNWEQHFLSYFSIHRSALQSLPLRDRSVLEIGAGNGELTALILEQDVAHVAAFEIDKGLCKISDSRLKLYEQDVQHPGILTPFEGWTLIANPPYSLLGFIIDQMTALRINDALLLIPERALPDFEALGFRLFAELPGNAFTPASTGRHFLVARGFDD